MLSVLIPEGFPVTAQEYLSTAVQSAFGGMASIVDMPKGNIIVTGEGVLKQFYKSDYLLVQ